MKLLLLLVHTLRGLLWQLLLRAQLALRNRNLSLEKVLDTARHLPHHILSRYLWPLDDIGSVGLDLNQGCIKFLIPKLTKYVGEEVKRGRKYHGCGEE